MDLPYNQQIREAFQELEVLSKRTILYIKIFSVVYFISVFVLAYAQIIPLNGVTIFLSVMGFIILILIISSPLNIGYNRILKLAIQDITRELTCNSWQYWASHNLAPNEASKKSRHAFPFGRTTTINYVLKGQYKNLEMWIVSMSVMKARTGHTKDPRYDFNGHIFNFSVPGQSQKVIITNETQNDYFKIPSEYKLFNNEGNTNIDVKIYKSDNSSVSDDGNKLKLMFQELSRMIPDSEILLKTDSGELTVAINDNKNLFDQYITINKKTNIQEFIGNTEEAVRYLSGIADIIVEKVHQ